MPSLVKRGPPVPVKRMAPPQPAVAPEKSGETVCEEIDVLWFRRMLGW